MLVNQTLAYVSYICSLEENTWLSLWETDQESDIIFHYSQGLRETKHPYTFVAREGFREMLEVDDAVSRTLPILSKLIVPLRAALVSLT